MVMLGDVNYGVEYETMTGEDVTMSWYSLAKIDDLMARHEQICCPFGAQTLSTCQNEMDLLMI